MKKKTYEEVKYYIEIESKSECELLTLKEDYVDTHHEITCRCKCKNIFTTDFHRIVSKGKLHCNECGLKISANKQKKDGQIVYNEFIEKNYIPQFKPIQYKNAKIKLSYICDNHKEKGVQYISYDNFKQGKGCKYCTIDINRESYKIQHKNIIENRGYFYINTIFKNKKTYYQYKCNKHLDFGTQTILSSNFDKGQGCKLCGIEKYSLKRRNKIDKIINIFNERDYIYHQDNIYENNLSVLKYKCNKHLELGWQETNFANVRTSQTCIKCINEKISGENHYLWKGGISPLHNYLRYKINDWKRDSLKKYDFKCGITDINSNDLIVHHLYSFNLILEETLNELNLDVRNGVNKYNNEELNKIEKLFVKKHYEYGYGIPLIPFIHNLYHRIKGKGNNTAEEFFEFKENYINGKYKDLEGVN